MENEEQKEVETRKLKIKGGKLSGEKGSEKKDVKERESGSKIWVLIILGVSVVVSLVFSFKSKTNVGQQTVPVNTQQRLSIPDITPSKSGLFGPAEYEYQK